jgi:hypothetical protein
MNSPIVRLATSTHATRLGFFAAGLTIAGIAIIQSFSIMLAWIASFIV